MKRFIDYLYKLIKQNKTNVVGLWFFMSLMSWGSERTILYAVSIGFILVLIIYVMVTIDWLYVHPLREKRDKNIKQ